MNLLINLCRIIQAQLGLTDGQVWVYDQKRDIPVSSNLWVVVRYLGGKPFGSSSKVIDAIETQVVHMNSTVTVDVFSRDQSAMEAKEQVIMAFRSQFSQQMQEKYAYKISVLPGHIPDLSPVEGPGILYRFQLTFQVQHMIESKRSVDYFDTFPTSTVVTEA